MSKKSGPTTTTTTTGGANNVNLMGGGGGGSGGGGGIANVNFIDGIYPVGSRLNALYKRGFGYKTIGYRLPVILTKIIDQLSRDKNKIGDQLGHEARDEIKLIVGQLAQLKNELQTNKSIRPLPILENSSNKGNTSDEKENVIWNNYLTFMSTLESGTNCCNKSGTSLDDVRWYNASWLYVECYLYRRIYDSFISTSHFQQFDYFSPQKEEGYYETLPDVKSLANFVVVSNANAAKSSRTYLQSLLELSLWGNRCDLSLSAGESSSDSSVGLLGQLTSLRQKCLCDDSGQFWAKLEEIKASSGSSGSSSNHHEGQGSSSTGTSIGYVLDNAGFELFTDLCLADALVENFVGRVDFYVKTIPWFISDTMEKDFHWLLNAMAMEEEEANEESASASALTQLAQKWKGHLASGRWRIVADPFWTYPHTYTEMKVHEPNLYNQLSSHSLLIFKGDLNYRKLVADINWKKSTPFGEALQTFHPAPLFALRTIKADTVAGLQSEELAESLERDFPDWMITGEFGLLQYSDIVNN